MIVLAFFSWWYGRGWVDTVARLSQRLRRINSTFSVQLLTKTLFSPWRRIISYPGASLSDHARAWADNIVSRAIGFVVRCFVLLAAALMAIIVTLLTLVEIIVWPLLPPGILVCIALGVAR